MAGDNYELGITNGKWKMENGKWKMENGKWKNCAKAKIEKNQFSNWFFS
jgi:predicted choloylglycine hydrolase